MCVCASGAAIKPELVRPVSVLRECTHYLLNKIVDRQEEEYADIYVFVADRFRAIRQDLVCQEERSRDAVRMYEIQVRMLVMSEYLLGAEPDTKYNPKLNYDAITQVCMLLMPFLHLCVHSEHIMYHTF